MNKVFLTAVNLAAVHRQSLRSINLNSAVKTQFLGAAAGARFALAVPGSSTIYLNCKQLGGSTRTSGDNHRAIDEPSHCFSRFLAGLSHVARMDFSGSDTCVAGGPQVAAQIVLHPDGIFAVFCAVTGQVKTFCARASLAQHRGGIIA